MSQNIEVRRIELTKLLKKAAAQDRRNLGISILFTIVVLAVGFAAIAYSANKVLKLKAQEASLNASIQNSKGQIAELQEVLRNLKADFDNVQPTLDKIAKGETASKQEAKKAADTLSKAQERVQLVLDSPTPNRERTLTRSSSLITVPSVKDLTLRNAEQNIRAAGLTPVRVDEPHESPKGTVVYQEPAAGQQVAPHGQVKVYVAVPVAIVPYVCGLPFNEASQRLEQVGLKARRIEQRAQGTPNTVAYQDPLQDKRVPAGSSVLLYVVSQNR
jgi:hypothetical protein